MRWARCNHDGRPLSPGDQAAVDEFRQLLAARAGAPPLYWRELRGEHLENGPYWEEWYCPVPPVTMSYCVIRGEWIEPGDDVRAVSCGPAYPVRRIFEIRTWDAAETRAAVAADRAGPAGPGPAPAAGSGTIAAIIAAQEGSGGAGGPAGPEPASR